MPPRPDAPASPGSRSIDQALPWLAAAFVLAGFLLRLWSASLCRFHGDEALHWVLFHQPDAVEVYRQSLTNAHPPLYFQLLYWWHLLGDSELFLRLPAVVFGSLACWQAWRWVALTCGRAAALVAAALLSLSPSLILLSAEVRGYGVFLCLLLTALHAHEVALGSGRPRAVVVCGMALALAILTHYSALWVVIALALYTGVRLRGAPLPVVRRWLLLGVLVAALYGLLLLSHVLRIRGTPMEQFAIATWLNSMYFQAGRDQLLTWIPQQAAALGTWWFGLRRVFEVPVGPVVAILFLAGVVLLVLRRRMLVVLLVTPVLLAGAASWLHLYPFGGSRHSAWLVPLLAAGVGVAVAQACGRRLWLVVGLSAAAGFLPWMVIGNEQTQRFRAQETPQQMAAAVDHLRTQIPADGILLADQQTRALLDYYAMRDQFAARTPGPGGFYESRLNGRRLLSVLTWHESAATLPGTLALLKTSFGLPAGQVVWVVSAGVERNLLVDLAAQGRLSALVAPQQFGQNLGVFGIALP